MVAVHFFSFLFRVGRIFISEHCHIDHDALKFQMFSREMDTFFFLLESYSSHALKQDEIMVFYHFKLNDAHQVYDHLAFGTYFLIGTKRTYTLARTNSFPTLWYLKTTKFYGNYSIPQSSYYREIIFNETVLFYGFIDSKTCTQSHTSIVYTWKFSCKTHNNTVYVLFGTFDLNLVTH